MKKEALLRRYNAHLTMRNYRPCTKRAYFNAINKFFEFCQVNGVDGYDLFDYAKAYIVFRFDSGKSWSTVNIDYSTIKILFVEVLKMKWSYEMIPRPRGHKRLPTILSTGQVEAMINSITNLKHKTIVVLMYATGLRVSEVINVNLEHILIDRKQLKVVYGKGGKDRLLNIPSVFLVVLEHYVKIYQPKRYLFEGANQRNRYSASSIRKIVDRAAKSVEILAKVSPHSLRYAYATHHIENGTDLVTLQKQLGHKNINTTIKYVNLCQMQYRNINHPIDLLNIDLRYLTRSVKSSGHTVRIT